MLLANTRQRPCLPQFHFDLAGKSQSHWRTGPSWCPRAGIFIDSRFQSRRVKPFTQNTRMESTLRWKPGSPSLFTCTLSLQPLHLGRSQQVHIQIMCQTQRTAIGGSELNIFKYIFPVLQECKEYTEHRYTRKK